MKDKKIEVVQLVWKPYESHFSRDYYAETWIGHYIVMKDYENGNVTCYYSDQGHIGEPSNSYDEAKEVCQKDFERRINECISLSNTLTQYKEALRQFIDIEERVLGLNKNKTWVSETEVLQVIDKAKQLLKQE